MDARVVPAVVVASVWVFRSELAKLWPSPLAWLWAAVVSPMVLPKELVSALVLE